MISSVTCLLFLATAGALAAASAAAAIGASQQQFPSVASGGLGGGGSAGMSADFGDGGFSDGISPPDPSKFKTPEELKEYLERLQLYYALVGRPRFGKRSGRDFSSSSSRGRVFDYNRKAEEDEDEAEESTAAIPRDRIYGFTVLL